MSTISIRRSHHLTPKQAIEVAKKVAADLAKEYAITSTWAGSDTVHVQGTGLTGKLHLAPNVFELDIKLGFMLAMFRDKIRDGVEAKFDKLLVDKATKKK
jgi:putative polyhydroxyalkanoate system protein